MAHPEVGRPVIDRSGPLCTCGFRGCWESLATGPAMIAWLRTHVAPDHCYPADRTAGQVGQLARQGDAMARHAGEHESYYLGLGLANLINLFLPAVTVLCPPALKTPAPSQP